MIVTMLKSIKSVEKGINQEEYQGVFTNNVKQTISYNDEPIPSAFRAPSPVAEIIIDPVRDINTE